MKKEEIGKKQEIEKRIKKKQKRRNRKEERRKAIAVSMTSMHRKSYHIITTVLWPGANDKPTEQNNKIILITGKKRHYK